MCVQRCAPQPMTGGIMVPSRFNPVLLFFQNGNNHPGVIGKNNILMSYITNWRKEAQRHVEQTDPHQQRHRSNQVQPVCWILNEAEAALQQALRVKVPDFAWVILRLIRVPATASCFGSGHELQQNESSLLALSPSLFLSLSISPSLQARQDDYSRGWADENGIFRCIPCRDSDQRLSNLDLLPGCYIYEPR